MVSLEVFADPAFDAKGFVANLRKQLPLTSLQQKLQELQQQVQAAVVELINQDYADFVSLSGNLVGLDDRLTILAEPLQSVREDITELLSTVQQEYQALSANLERREHLRNAEVELRRLLDISHSVDKIERLLQNHGSTDPADASTQGLDWQLIDRVATELNQLNYHVDRVQDTPFLKELRPRLQHLEIWMTAQLSSALNEAITTRAHERLTATLKLFGLVGWRERAVAAFDELVTVPILTDLFQAAQEQASTTDLRSAVDSLFSQILVVARDQFVAYRAAFVAASIEHDVLVDSLWPRFVDGITTHLSNLFSPGIPATFHAHYTSYMSFLGQFEQCLSTQNAVERFRKSTAYLTMERRWTLPVYFQLRFQEIAGALERALQELSKATSTEGGDASEALLGADEALLKGLEKCWQSDYFLPALTHRFWKLTLQCLAQLLARHRHAIRELGAQHYLSPVIPHVLAAMRQLPPRVCATLIAEDSPRPMLIPKYAAHLLFSIISFMRCKLLRKINLPFLSLSFATALLQRHMGEDLAGLPTEVLTTVATALLKEAEVALKPSADVPRLYRLTGRPAPTEASAYTSEAFLLYDRVVSYEYSDMDAAELRARFMTGLQEMFVKMIESVLADVQETEQSLQYRRRRTKRKTGAEGLSDSDKMRTQFVLDGERVQQQMRERGAGDTGLLTECVERIRSHIGAHAGEEEA
ncbi:uncharacterized protein MONBRDRAFT_37489 [Monosiga brevicollis MX1]|uniref:Conserved oligomeric Golgi complex subunit 2 n=1 Tax=Monosiga brevicollis TaxID=81824 RepID=A9V223_MONBE|nr:uncharacterized protein MONBRDRAFT_37489 [Monosiga brevicollis MX1]EDQ88667.1 predicted protein [Monosiga brevicollis MX1]|eukprot:XP_001746771.1 hypothetical protein [Monosiga brevicollis MX1]